MAIRVGGTVVVDDSRNLSNIAQVNATCTLATTVCGTTVCGTFCGSLGAVSASNLTGITASDQYICLIACETITAGSPVSTFGTCGVVTTKGGPANFCMGAPYGCIAPLANQENDKNQFVQTITALNFACNPNCFVTVMFSGGGGYCTAVNTGINCSPYACIRTHSVSATGGITTTCLCCYNYGPTGTNALSCIRCIQWGVAGSGGWCDTWAVQLHGPMPVCSCTGSQGAIYVPVIESKYCCYTGVRQGCTRGVEFYFCYCTTTCTIALLRHCHGPLYGGDPNVNAVAYVTNDRQYLVVPFCASNCACCGQACTSVCTGLYVKRLNDTMCLLSWSPAVTCTGVSWKDMLPASCAKLATWSCMGYAGTMPFTQGADGWTLNYYDTCLDSLGQTQPKIWAHRAVADNCYAMTNILCTVGCLYIPYFCGNGQCLACGDTFYGVGVAGQFAWDEANCKKMISSLGNSCVCICSVRINCFCVSGTTLAQTSFSDGTLYCCAQNVAQIIMYNFANKPYTNGYSCASSYSLHQSFYDNGFSASFANPTMLNQMAMYNASLPLCYQCSCYIFSGLCEVLLGRESCWLWSLYGSAVGSHDGNGCWVCWGGCDRPGAWGFKPSYGGGIINAVTQCGLNGQTSSTAGLHGLNLFPFYNNSNTLFTSAVSSRPYPTTSGGCCHCLCVGIGSSKIGYCEATVCSWLGVAQCGNTAGGVVQVATLGMVDRTSFSRSLSSYAGSACCLQAGFRCTIAVGTPCSLNSLTIGASTCGRLCNYAHSIVFRPYWDSGKGCYVTAMHGRTTMQDCLSA